MSCDTHYKYTCIQVCLSGRQCIKLSFIKLTFWICSSYLLSYVACSCKTRPLMLPYVLVCMYRAGAAGSWASCSLTCSWSSPATSPPPPGSSPQTTSGTRAICWFLLMFVTIQIVKSPFRHKITYLINNLLNYYLIKQFILNHLIVLR